MLDNSKFKIEIITKQNIPINIDNPVLSYIQNKDRKSDRLLVKIYYDGIEIGRGIVLDFYKKFEIIEDFGEPHTKVVSFEYHGKTMYKNTHFGQMIYKIKNFKNPPIDDIERKQYIKEITAIFESYIPSIEEKATNLKLSFIPSATKTPDDIAKRLHTVSNLELVKIIDKNTQDTIDSKNIQNFNDSMEHAKTKYILDKKYITENKSQFLIIDDVMGNGSSLSTILKNLYDMTDMLNYFLIVVKDVKR